MSYLVQSGLEKCTDKKSLNSHTHVGTNNCATSLRFFISRCVTWAQNYSAHQADVRKLIHYAVTLI